MHFARHIPARAMILALVGAGVLGACRGDTSEQRPRQFFPDMDDQPKVKAQSESRFFDEYVDEEGYSFGRAARLPVTGTVPFGQRPYVEPVAGVDFSNREEFLRSSFEINTGQSYVSNGRGGFVLDENGTPRTEYLERIPIEVTRDLALLGEENYNIYCLPCHGQTGKGDGTVGQKWAYALPSFHDPKYQPGAGEYQSKDGYIFHTIRNGVPNLGGPYPLKMPGYARKLSIEETWAVVAHYRVLQMTQKGTPDMLSPEDRMDLDRQRVATGAAEGGES
jgi:hypothetical protein